MRATVPSTVGQAARAVRWVGVTVVVLALAACGVPSSRGAEPLPSDLAAVAQPTVEPAPSAPQTRLGAVAWVRGDFLVPRPQPVEGPGRQALLTNALAALVAGPGLADREAGLTTLIPPDAAIAGLVSRRKAVVSLDLGLQSPIDPSLVVGQVALTALAVRGVRAVSFLVDGSVVEVPLPGGGTAKNQVTLRDYREVIRR